MYTCAHVYMYTVLAYCTHNPNRINCVSTPNCLALENTYVRTCVDLWYVIFIIRIYVHCMQLANYVSCMIVDSTDVQEMCVKDHKVVCRTGNE